MQWQTFSKVQDIEKGSTLYADIINHCRDYKNFIEKNSKITSAHECSHGIANTIRNTAGGHVNAFYLGQDRAIVIPEPNIKKSDVAQYIPSQLRSSRFVLYISGQTSWNDNPLYVYDEFIAYINGAWAGIDLKRQENYIESDLSESRLPYVASRTTREGKILFGSYNQPLIHFQGNRIIDGPVEFVSYATGLLIAANKANDLSQLLIDFSNWAFRRAYNSYFECLKEFAPFDSQDKLYQLQLNDACFSEQRKFLKDKINYTIPTGIESDDPIKPDDWVM